MQASAPTLVCLALALSPISPVTQPTNHIPLYVTKKYVIFLGVGGGGILGEIETFSSNQGKSLMNSVICTLSKMSKITHKVGRCFVPKFGS